MSVIFERLRIESTKQRTVDRFASLKVHVETTPLVMQDNWRETFMLVGVIAVEFTANPAEYPRAKMAAKQMLVQQLYGDTLNYLAKLEHCVYSEDREAIVKMINEIRHNLLDVK